MNNFQNISMRTCNPSFRNSIICPFPFVLSRVTENPPRTYNLWPEVYMKIFHAMTKLKLDLVFFFFNHKVSSDFFENFPHNAISILNFNSSPRLVLYNSVIYYLRIYIFIDLFNEYIFTLIYPWIYDRPAGELFRFTFSQIVSFGMYKYLCVQHVRVFVCVRVFLLTLNNRHLKVPGGRVAYCVLEWENWDTTRERFVTIVTRGLAIRIDPLDLPFSIMKSSQLFNARFYVSIYRDNKHGAKRKKTF